MMHTQCGNCGITGAIVKCGCCLKKMEETDSMFAQELIARLKGHWDTKPIHPSDFEGDYEDFVAYYGQTFTAGAYREYDGRKIDWLDELQDILEERIELT